jgi:nitroimidazol reductase NimA-like FMN-containing flavoprotein (pyridoxamine 5'-phosphate oxidase superfamily)
LALAASALPDYARSMSEFTPTERTQVKRLPARAAYDADTVYKILDEAFLCHVGFVADGQPFVIPTGYARLGDTVYIHGSAASRMLRTLSEGVQVCVTVTLIDGLVLARSVFHHSMNYRSVVILGRAALVRNRERKMRALEAFTEQVVRGRWRDARKPTDAELKATSVLALRLREVSAKIRTGPPKDDEQDYALPIWAGVVPLRLMADSPVRDPRLELDLAPPDYVRNYSR